jgi:hypothetical protein
MSIITSARSVIFKMSSGKWAGSEEQDPAYACLSSATSAPDARVFRDDPDAQDDPGVRDDPGVLADRGAPVDRDALAARADRAARGAPDDLGGADARVSPVSLPSLPAARL